ncbi:hypothetical protein [Paraburkholderia acidisoli]|uniref:Uncharacterized protein n=1 Tax=Paraburkholderia acidisoli TaxID=2571748 RepID=A0A7Z2JGD8_9BURK|nr:hypothetical protein [Paraburkholderia acidisoli]QGZ62394.1 hypothetical protein FAZ98_12020 [Paraburkholderia acidisoli]
MKKSNDPSQVFLQTLTSLYFYNAVKPISGRKEADELPPMEALVLGMMCLTKTYNSRNFTNLLYRKYGAFDSRECDKLTEVGILGLVERGYLKPASKKAEAALDERDMEIWGLGDVPFVVTAKGAKRIGYVVANLRGEDVKDVIKGLQAESKEAAKGWATSL